MVSLFVVFSNSPLCSFGEIILSSFNSFYLVTLACKHGRSIIRDTIEGGGHKFNGDVTEHFN